MNEVVLLGDEAVALGAIHAGLSLAYGYPGTPSTEIMEYLIDRQKPGSYSAHWCSNEKTAYEAAVGASLMNRRTLVTMKHVGLNVAADPFMNSVLMKIQGGLVLAVADDPGMHSSQNEQDSRWFADYAKMPCLEPRNQQEAYEMTREAFDISERFHVPVMIKLVTRLSHSRAVVQPGEARAENESRKFQDPTDYMVLPAISRRNYSHHLEIMKDIEAWSQAHEANRLSGLEIQGPRAVITTGLGGNYYEENLAELPSPLPRLHLGCYPLPEGSIIRLLEGREEVLCIEEGYPYVERLLRGILPGSIRVRGKLDGSIPPSGELDPDVVRPALGLKHRRGLEGTFALGEGLPGRPPQLCPACPHADSYISLKEALQDFPDSLVTSDIGCYTLGYLAPHKAIETALCMGASIPMARGAAEAGMHPAIATIGDSTFMHSGLTGLADAAALNTPMTILILDNETTAMTGGQDTVVTSARIREAVKGLGVDPEHIVELVPLPKRREENTALMKKEFAYRGLSVIIAIRECVQTLKKRNLAKKEAVA